LASGPHDRFDPQAPCPRALRDASAPLKGIVHANIRVADRPGLRIALVWSSCFSFRLFLPLPVICRLSAIQTRCVGVLFGPAFNLALEISPDAW